MKMKVQLVTTDLQLVNHDELLLDDNIVMVILKDVEHVAADRAFMFSMLASDILRAQGMPKDKVAFVEVTFSYLSKEDFVLN